MTIVAIAALSLALISLGTNYGVFIALRRRAAHGRRAEKKAIALLWQLKERIEACPSHEALEQVRRDVERYTVATLHTFEKETIAPLRKDGERVRAFAADIEKQIGEVEEHMDPKAFVAARRLVRAMKVLERWFPRKPRHKKRERDLGKRTEEFPGAALSPS